MQIAPVDPPLHCTTGSLFSILEAPLRKARTGARRSPTREGLAMSNRPRILLAAVLGALVLVFSAARSALSLTTSPWVPRRVCWGRGSPRSTLDSNGARIMDSEWRCRLSSGIKISRPSTWYRVRDVCRRESYLLFAVRRTLGRLPIEPGIRELRHAGFGRLRRMPRRDPLIAAPHRDPRRSLDQ